MSHALDLKGKRSGKLTVLEAAGSNKDRQRLWRCRCDCGKECKVIAGRLSAGTAKSCGCLQRQTLKDWKNRDWRRRMALQ